MNLIIVFILLYSLASFYIETNGMSGENFHSLIYKDIIIYLA